MKYFLAILSVATINSVMYCMDNSRITVPAKSVLKERFKKNGLSDFDKAVKFSKRYGGKECHREGFKFLLDNAMIAYQNHPSTGQLTERRVRKLERLVRDVVSGQR